MNRALRRRKALPEIDFVYFSNSATGSTGAGSVATKDIPANRLAVGNPYR
jgi:hypothetical protein